MKTKALKKRLGLQVLLNLEEVFNHESPLAAKSMRKRLKSAAKSLVKEFMKRSRAIDSKARKKRTTVIKDASVKRKSVTVKKKAAKTPTSKK